MSQLTPQQFDALWESAKSGPVFRQADVKPIQADLSLSGILDQYMAMAARYRDQGTISHLDYDELAAGVTALKVILARIKDKDLVAQEMSRRADTIAQQVRAKVTSLTASGRR